MPGFDSKRVTALVFSHEILMITYVFVQCQKLACGIQKCLAERDYQQVHTYAAHWHPIALLTNFFVYLAFITHRATTSRSLSSVSLYRGNFSFLRSEPQIIPRCLAILFETALYVVDV